ncbi:M48 family metallopeptidase [Candidatus Falkowbacteria bacterium]|nr:M48 family metallopeptidase [Candidatus Falkowbacteria bacterium]
MYNQIDSNKRKSIFLIFIFFILIAGIGYILSRVLNYGYSPLVIAVVISMFMVGISYFAGDKIALISAGAKSIGKEENPYVYRIVENLCITAGLPTPKIYIINDPAPNAFATGRNPEHSSIAITTGLIQTMENEELEGVIAHELSHVKNYDVRLATLVVVLVGALSIIADMFLRSFLFGGRRSNNNKNGNGILAIIGIILIILSPIIGQLIQLAISRKREFLADASGALMTRYPEGLARALEKISQYKQPMQRFSNATAHLFFTNPYFSSKKFLSSIFSTHPPIEQRIQALRNMI